MSNTNKKTIIEDGKKMPYKAFILSREECDALVDRMLSSKNPNGYDTNSDTFKFKSFEFEGCVYHLLCYVKEEKRRHTNETFYRLTWFLIDENEDFVFGEEKPICAEALKDVIFEIASKDYSKKLDKKDKVEKTEKTYIDMLTELSEALEKDSIPEQDKMEIEIHLNSLKSILWNYSS